METVKIGYARCSTLSQYLKAQRKALRELGVHESRIYTDHGLTGTNRERPGLEQALDALREGDTLVVSKLDRPARSVPDARTIADELRERGVKLALGATVHDPSDPMGKMFFNIVATFAEFEADLIRMRTREGMAIAKAKGKLRGETAETVGKTTERALANARYRGIFDQRSGRGLLRIMADRLSNVEQAENLLTYDSAPGIDPSIRF